MAHKHKTHKQETAAFAALVKARDILQRTYGTATPVRNARQAAGATALITAGYPLNSASALFLESPFVPGGS